MEVTYSGKHSSLLRYGIDNNSIYHGDDNIDKEREQTCTAWGLHTLDHLTRIWHQLKAKSWSVLIEQETVFYKLYENLINALWSKVMLVFISPRLSLCINYDLYDTDPLGLMSYLINFRSLGLHKNKLALKNALRPNIGRTYSFRTKGVEPHSRLLSL